MTPMMNTDWAAGMIGGGTFGGAFFGHTGFFVGALLGLWLGLRKRFT